MRTYWLSLFLIAAATACDEGARGTASLEPTASVRLAESSACTAVAFTVTLTPTSPLSFNGDVSGDLVGSVTVQFDASSVAFAGVTISNAGTAMWAITSGVLGPVNFQTAFNNRNLAIDRPGSPSDVFENIGRHRALTGVSMANLEYTGIFVASPPIAHQDYRGVICQ